MAGSSVLGWIEPEPPRQAVPGQLSKLGRQRARAFALLARDIYPDQTNSTTRGNAALVKNWIELLGANPTAGFRFDMPTIRSYLGKMFGFNAAVYNLHSMYDDCRVLSFQGSASLLPKNSAGAVHAIQDWLLTNLPTTLDVLNEAESSLGPLFTKILNPRKAPSTQYDIADLVTKEAMNNMRNGNLILTGHSLGGGLAQYAAIRNGLKSIVFNSAGIGYDRTVKSTSDQYLYQICHLLTTTDEKALADLKSIVAGVGLMATGAMALAHPALYNEASAIFSAGRRMTDRPFPDAGKLFDQILNRIVTSTTDPLSHHIGSAYVLGEGGHSMEHVLRHLPS